MTVFALDPSVQAAAITGACTVLVALVGVVVELLRRGHKALQAVREHAEVTRGEVQNAHRTNLRDDLDHLMRGVDQLLDGQQRHAELLREHARDIGGIRQELRHERTERLDIERRVDRLSDE